jgi:type IV pilus assembly protein PilN
MIRINLLPLPKARKIKKRAELRSQLVLTGLLFVLILIICSYFWFDLNKKIRQLQDTKVRTTQELAELKEKVKEVENYEQNKKNLQEKNQIIEQLKKNQSGPVHLLDEISIGLEPLKVWLISLSVQGNQVDIDGKAITNSEIVEFINNLKASKYFSDIVLIESRQVIDSGIPVYSFKLRTTLVL